MVPTTEAAEACANCGRLEGSGRGVCSACLAKDLGRYERLPSGRWEPKAEDVPVPAEPTDALPGSPEKVAVMEARLAAGVQLHHPLDATLATLPERLGILARGSRVSDGGLTFGRVVEAAECQGARRGRPLKKPPPPVHRYLGPREALPVEE